MSGEAAALAVKPIFRQPGVAIIWTPYRSAMGDGFQA
jgi:hypothetical protein